MKVKELTPSAKTRITQDWSGRFPGLGVYRKLHLLRRVGPLLEGICLERDSGNRSYRPTFHVHNLCRKDSSISLSLRQPVLTARTHAPQTIQVRWHDEMYRDAADRLESQSPLAFSGDLRLEDVLKAYHSYIAKLPAVEHEYVDMVTLATWAGRKQIALETIERSIGEIARWPALLIDRIGGISSFRDKLLSLTVDPNALRGTCEEQVVSLGASHVPTADLIA